MRKGMKLYRYDLVCPPNSWDTEYKSIEYQYELLGQKNKIGAFFFYDNCCDCFQTALNAAKKREKSTFYITTCQLIDDVNILHLQATSIYMLITKLYEDNIDVLTDDFIIYKNSQSIETFRTIRDDYAQLREMIDSLNSSNDTDFSQIILQNRLIAKVHSVFGSSNNIGGKYDYFGQLLTDFDNGVAYKKLLQANGYEGYCFYEGYNDSTPQVTTYCLFSSNKLSAPTHREFSLGDVSPSPNL